MSFASPWLLLGLLLVPLAIVGYVLIEQWRGRKAAGWSKSALLPNMMPSSPGARRHIPLALFLIGLILLLAGFARPQATIDVPREGATVVLAMDISGSMNANDVKPTRLLAARAAVLQFMNEIPSKYRVALVTFSNHAAVRVPPTYDHSQLAKAIPLKAQQEGTSLSSGLTAALAVAQRAIGKVTPGVSRPPAAVLMLSDGSQTVGQVDPTSVAAKARKLGIPVSTVSLGTPQGVVIHKIQGGSERIAVPPAPATLQQIAQVTNGRFFQAGSAEQLQQVYKDMGSRLVQEKKQREITVVVAGAAIVFLIAGALLSGVWFRRLV
jgi:Ca-activated chloride channel family protein